MSRDGKEDICRLPEGFNCDKLEGSEKCSISLCNLQWKFNFNQGDFACQGHYVCEGQPYNGGLGTNNKGHVD